MLFSEKPGSQMKTSDLDVGPRGRVDRLLHRGLHLVHQSLTHTGGSKEQQLVGSEALLDVAGRVWNPEPDQSIKLCKTEKASAQKKHLMCQGRGLCSLGIGGAKTLKPNFSLLLSPELHLRSRTSSV